MPKPRELVVPKPKAMGWGYWSAPGQPFLKKPITRALAPIPFLLGAYQLFSMFLQVRGYQSMMASRLPLYLAALIVVVAVWIFASSLPKMRLLVGLVFTVLTVAAAVSIDYLTINPPGNVSPPDTVHSLFAKDFPNAWGFGFAPRSLILADGTAVPFEARLLIDPVASVKFVAIYIPDSPKLYDACAGLADHIHDVGGLDLFTMEAGGAGTEQIDSSKYQFSGRVFIYYEGFLSPEQNGDLHRLYASKNLDLETRGQSYLELISFQKIATKDAGR